MKMKKMLALVLVLMLTLGAAQAATLVTANAQSVVNQVNRERAARGR